MLSRRFYLMTVWLVPFALFLSLAANDQTLPGGPGGLPGGGGSSLGALLLSFRSSCPPAGCMSLDDIGLMYGSVRTSSGNADIAAPSRIFLIAWPPRLLQRQQCCGTHNRRGLV